MGDCTIVENPTVKRNTLVKSWANPQRQKARIEVMAPENAIAPVYGRFFHSRDRIESGLAWM